MYGALLIVNSLTLPHTLHELQVSRQNVLQASLWIVQCLVLHPQSVQILPL